jgi:hypothetical protein
MNVAAPLLVAPARGATGGEVEVGIHLNDWRSTGRETQWVAAVPAAAVGDVHGGRDQRGAGEPAAPRREQR